MDGIMVGVMAISMVEVKPKTLKLEFAASPLIKERE
jgi:hypothetical protein